MYKTFMRKLYWKINEELDKQKVDHIHRQEDSNNHKDFNKLKTEFSKLKSEFSKLKTEFNSNQKVPIGFFK